jgi:transcriptional regulator with XRE-family HTH domain
MKHPELGTRIAKQRKQKGMTQEELANTCKITTRSIQRIEAGEVFPRTYTLKNIAETLGLDFGVLENIKNNTEFLNNEKHPKGTPTLLFSKKAESIIRIALMFGVINIFFAITEVVISYIQYKNNGPSNAATLMSVFVYFASFVTCIVYLYGLFVIGKLNRNIFLMVGSIAFMLIMVLVKGDDIISASNSFLHSYLNRDARYIMFGSVILMNGIGLLSLRNKYGFWTLVAGIIDCLNGIVFIMRMPFPIGLIFLSIARIAETIMMYQISVRIACVERDL